MRTKPYNEEVLFADARIVKIGRREIDILKEKSRHNARRRMRLCAHPNIEDPLHEMFIIHHKGTYVRPHKHLNKMESSYIVEGRVDVVVFNDDGMIDEVIRMGDYASGHQFYLRISDPCFHMLLIRSDFLVFHEITNGPFRKSDTVFAPWSPDENDDAAVHKWMAQLERMVDTFGTTGKNAGLLIEE